MFRIPIALFFAAILSGEMISGGAFLRADVFLMKESGKIDGNLLNVEEVPRKTYRIETTDGLEIEIEAKYVERVRKGEREALVEYESTAPFKEDTIANHLELAEWCSKNQLPELSRQHLSRILEHNPDHKEARQRLGHFKTEDGSWTTRQEQLGNKGFKKYNGSWKTQQQIDVDQILERRKKAEIYWEKRISALRAALPRNEKAMNELLAIEDSAASSALRKALGEERNEDIRILLIKALANIKTSAALHEIARWTLNPRENVTEVRQTCLDELRNRPEVLPAIIGFYTSQLQPANDAFTINAAARALAELDGKSAISALINVLVVHREWTEKQKADGPAFSNTGGNALGWGEKTIKRQKDEPNPRVLEALIRLTGSNFQYDKDAWKTWFIQAQQTPTFNARRN